MSQKQQPAVRHETLKGIPHTITIEPEYDGIHHHLTHDKENNITRIETTYKKYEAAAGVPRAKKLYQYQKWLDWGGYHR